MKGCHDVRMIVSVRLTITWPIPYSQLLEYQADNVCGHRQPRLWLYLRHG